MFTRYLCYVGALSLLRLGIMYVAFTYDKRRIQTCYVYLSSDLYCNSLAPYLFIFTLPLCLYPPPTIVALSFHPPAPLCFNPAYQLLDPTQPPSPSPFCSGPWPPDLIQVQSPSPNCSAHSSSRSPHSLPAVVNIVAPPPAQSPPIQWNLNYLDTD